MFPQKNKIIEHLNENIHDIIKSTPQYKKNMDKREKSLSDLNLHDDVTTSPRKRSRSSESGIMTDSPKIKKINNMHFDRSINTPISKINRNDKSSEAMSDKINK